MREMGRCLREVEGEFLVFGFEFLVERRRWMWRFAVGGDLESEAGVVLGKTMDSRYEGGRGWG